MKKNTLKTLGFMVLSTAILAFAVTGCGSKGTGDVPATEMLEAVEDTEAVETVAPETETEETEEIEAEVTETTEETETAEAETTEAPAYTVTDMSATKYAKQSVNVRKGPSADDEKLGGLSTNQKVTVTGQADNGWYRIEYNGAEGYVSGKYLADQKVAVNTNTGNSNTASASGAGNTADNSSNGTIDTTQSVNGAASANTDNSGWADTSSSAPAVDNAVNTPGADNSASASAGTSNSNGGSIDLSTATDEELGLTGFGGLSQGGSAGTGVGGNWIE